ncbi:MAG: aldolase/citrate lyase family protein [Burkholderiales bacterium]|jgi:citrate lyase subunit beta/citryl-CoA lyase
MARAGSPSTQSAPGQGTAAQHPDLVLFQADKALPALPACEHFAGNEKFIRKAFGLQSELGKVFDVTCDCEDGAPAGEERTHAHMVAKLLNEPEHASGRAGARIHDPKHSAWKQDVDILIGEAGANLAYVTVPKPLSYDAAAAAVDYIQSCANGAGIAAPPVHILVETQSALADVFRIASIPGLQGLVFGLLDFVSDHQGAVPASAMRSPGQFQHRLIVRAKAEVAAAALANGLVPVHNPCLDIKDPAVPREDARIAREEFGFLRMYSIHPGQIKPIVEAMQPSADDIARAADILLAAHAANWGPVSHRGEMHDRASYRYFWDLLKRARATGADIPRAAEDAFFPRDFPVLGKNSTMTL